jgi:cysteine-rich repeat protein
MRSLTSLGRCGLVCFALAWAWGCSGSSDDPAGGGGTGGPCNGAEDCPAPAGECLVAACNDGVCGEAAVARGAPTSVQTPGDCQRTICDGEGGTVTENEGDDVADDGKTCTIESCRDGVPTQKDAPFQTACGDGDGLICDGAGQCVGCTEASQCGAPTECATPSCGSDEVCGSEFTAAGTALVAGQTAGDCRELRCDGHGDKSSAIDDSDFDDGDACTDDSCDGGVPSHVDVCICGDGIVAGSETCDDEGTDPDDGCSDTCEAEPDYTCTGEPSDCVRSGTSCDAPLVVTTDSFALAGVDFAATYGEDGTFGSGTDCVDAVGGGGADAVFQVTLGPNQAVTLSEHGATFDALLHILTDEACVAGAACVASIDGLQASETETNGIRFQNGETAQTVFLVVETYSSLSATAPFDIHIEIDECGDGQVDAPETCDDGGTDDADGCSATCNVESGYACDGTSLSTCYDISACTTVTCLVGPCDGGTVISATQSAGLPLAIPDNNVTGVSSVLTIPATAGTIRHLALGLDVTHGYVSDMDIFLSGPSGPEVGVTSDNGSLNDNYTNTFFRDGVPTLVTAGTAPFTGVFVPETPFTQFVGASATGAWTLRVADDTATDTGTLDGYEIAMCIDPP